MPGDLPPSVQLRRVRSAQPPLAAGHGIRSGSRCTSRSRDLNPGRKAEPLEEGLTVVPCHVKLLHVCQAQPADNLSQFGRVCIRKVSFVDRLFRPGYELLLGDLMP